MLLCVLYASQQESILRRDLKEGNVVTVDFNSELLSCIRGGMGKVYEGKLD